MGAFAISQFAHLTAMTIFVCNVHCIVFHCRQTYVSNFRVRISTWIFHLDFRLGLRVVFLNWSVKMQGLKCEKRLQCNC